MTRNTYWILIQSSLWPFLALCLTVLAQASNGVDLHFIAWLGVLVVAAICAGFYICAIESYRSICYIETELRSLVEASISGRPFWKYESWLSRERGSNALWPECGPVILPIV